MKKVLKLILVLFGSIIGVLAFVVVLFLQLSPQFGQSPNEEQKIEYAKTGHYEDEKFINLEEFSLELNCHSITAMLREIFNPNPNISPSKNIEVLKISFEEINNKTDTLTRITWFGHSTFLIELDGKNILIDPVFGDYAAPHKWLGRKRYNEEMPIDIEQLPQIDAIIISHDHYDHLDYPSIEKLKLKANHFFVPLGVGNHLKSWNIPQEKIHELDWWQEIKFGSINLIFAPSKHMSGRGITDQSSTLWGSWIIKGNKDNIYFSGDGGYGSHFKEIGEKYGPFDIGLMECGQYNELWSDVHMMPEQTVQAGFDVRAKMILPIHWGAFTLAAHSWTDPIERVTLRAKEMGMPITTPQIGESVILGDINYSTDRWWENYVLKNKK